MSVKRHQQGQAVLGTSMEDHFLLLLASDGAGDTCIITQ